MKQAVKVIILSIIFGALAGGAATFLILATSRNSSDQERIRDFYYTENAVMVSPHSLRKMMDKGDKSYVLVDLRSSQEYEKEHIISALNIPAYKDPDTSDYGAVARIVSEFKKLPQDKDIIVYCYSTPCMTGRKVGKILADNNIYVKHLGIGWNEWRYYWNLWNHEHEWNQTQVEDYVASGQEPGTPKIRVDSSVCPIEGGLGC